MAVAKAELGVKRICPSCGARFYDLMKRPIECPKCKFSFEPEALARVRRPRPEVREVPVAKPVVEDEDVVAEDVLEEDAEVEGDVVEDEIEDEEAVEPAEKPARRRKAPAIAVDEVDEAEIELPEDAEGIADDETDILVEEDDADDDALAEIDADIEPEEEEPR